MTRIAAPRRPGLIVRISEFVSKRILGKKLGARPKDVVGPLRVLAHNPRILMGYAALEEGALGRARTVPERLALLARERVSPLVGCPW